MYSHAPPVLRIMWLSSVPAMGRMEVVLFFSASLGKERGKEAVSHCVRSTRLDDSLKAKDIISVLDYTTKRTLAPTLSLSWRL